jgi:alpha-L-fucosidase
MFINGESMQDTEPWQVTREGDIWYLKKKRENTVYVFITETDWPFGERKEILLRSIRSTSGTGIRVLGHNGIILEYQPDIDPAPRFTETEGGLHISIMRAQRIYNDRKWPNPVVVRLDSVVYRTGSE